MAKAGSEFSSIDPELAAILATLTAEVNAGTKAGSVTFLKPGEHFLKMVYPEGRSLANFFEKYQNTYENKQYTYFLVDAVIADSTQEGIKDREKIQHIKATKTMINGILSQVAGGWPIFADEGIVLKIRIYKDGNQTKYDVVPMTAKFNSANCTYPEVSIEEAAKDQEEYSARQADPLAFVAPEKKSAVDVDY